MMLLFENRIINTDNVISITRAYNSLVFVGIYGPLTQNLDSAEAAQRALDMIFRTKQSHLDMRGM